MRIAFLRGIVIPLSMIASLGLSAPAVAQAPAIRIWPGPPPGSEDWAQKRTESEIGFNKDKVIHNVVDPTLTPFLPDASKANGTAIIICPGGGFRILAFDHEGVQVARWLNERGVTAFILKYRLADTGTTEEDLRKGMTELVAGIAKADETDKYAGLKDDPITMNVVPLAVADGKQAIKLVRGRAAEWNIAPDRIGIMGFSAGGGVVTGVVLESDAESRPNFAAPIYGGILSGKPVAPDAPPLFVLAANDDPLAGSSIGIASRWKAA
ncbi:alpha/beta hydrolase fold domain-containing protein, partial [Candidatus Sumerlaeota bacterium]|nr:alpha/beta hydrolase fold domain-containing protein [Candidatus Sumerlaeota bacterium]